MVTHRQVSSVVIDDIIFSTTNLMSCIHPHTQSLTHTYRREAWTTTTNTYCIQTQWEKDKSYYIKPSTHKVAFILFDLVCNVPDWTLYPTDRVSPVLRATCHNLIALHSPPFLQEKGFLHFSTGVHNLFTLSFHHYTHISLSTSPLPRLLHFPSACISLPPELEMMGCGWGTGEK